MTYTAPTEAAQWNHQHWWLTLAAPMLSFQRRCNCSNCVNCAQGHPWLRIEQEDSGTYRNMLERDWGITSYDDLHETLQSLATCSMHGESLEEEYSHYACMTPAAWQQFCNQEQDPVYQGLLRFVGLSAPYTGRAGIRGFDLARGAYMTRAGLACGLLSQEEFEFLHSYMALRAKGMFDSWHQYTLSMFFGRIYWGWSTQDDASTPRRVEELLAGECPVRENIRLSMQRIAAEPECPMHFVPWDGIELPDLDLPASMRAREERAQEAQA